MSLHQLATSHYLQSVFSRGSVVRVFKSKLWRERFQKQIKKIKITSVLCLWAVLCETTKLQELLSMRQTNQEQNVECSLENPQQLNHPTWKKHTLNANNISNEQPSLIGALGHT